MDRTLLRLGFILILIALLTGLLVPLFANPRLGLTAHIVGLLGGLLLIAIGIIAPSLALRPRAAALFKWGWVYATYANWLASVLGAATGASGMTPIAGSGTTGAPVAEGLVAFLLVSLSVAAILSSVLALLGLRQPASTAHWTARSGH